MKKYPKHYAPNPKEWVPHLPKMQWQCCDCGLVHNVEFKIRTLDVRMTRNLKETKITRRKNKQSPNP